MGTPILKRNKNKKIKSMIAICSYEMHGTQFKFHIRTDIYTNFLLFSLKLNEEEHANLWYFLFNNFLFLFLFYDIRSLFSFYFLSCATLVFFRLVLMWIICDLMSNFRFVCFFSSAEFRTFSGYCYPIDIVVSFSILSLIRFSFLFYKFFFVFIHWVV